jgi:hypothetical protein
MPNLNIIRRSARTCSVKHFTVVTCPLPVSFYKRETHLLGTKLLDLILGIGNTVTKSGTVFTTLHFLCNLQVGPVSKSVTLQ